MFGVQSFFTRTTVQGESCSNPAARTASFHFEKLCITLCFEIPVRPANSASEGVRPSSVATSAMASTIGSLTSWSSPSPARLPTGNEKSFRLAKLFYKC
jgi:hypothetical protein